MHHRPTQAKINLSAILSNYQQAVKLAPKAQQLAVIKADAYGHGAVDVAAYLEPHVPAFAVAFIDEALSLRAAGIDKPIVILEGLSGEEELRLAAQYNFWPLLHSNEQLIALTALSPVPDLHCWLKVDTGMHRLGLTPVEAQSWVDKLTRLMQRKPVLASHFSCAEEPDSPISMHQMQQLFALAAHLDCEVSLANSAALTTLPQSAVGWNRPGIMLYGSSPIAGKSAAELGLQVAMTVTSQIMAIRDVLPGETVGYNCRWQADTPSRIATLPIGYADGYPRLINSASEVFLHGQRAKVVGTVSMDMLTIDVTHIPQVQAGDEVELWGENIPVNEVAAHANTIGYELLTRVTQRMQRIYLRD
ncbi:alanine racemase [Bowmanella pacifica]|uniref:Alanine racemase n=1 Tax=Bowmanella pacifica TaxID=502051 RepID=A0A917YXF2_9ALTE|nr:alanine racemase [Bowmanella pacifica]GGO67397.1 alanine racemase, biosynthetic [Bowmanella pacifica]